MYSCNLVKVLVCLNIAAIGLTHPAFAAVQDLSPNAGTAKLRMVVQEPVATNLHVSIVPVTTCKATSDIWLSGGAKSFYIPRVGMLGSPAVREGIVEVEIPAGSPIGIPVNMHIAKLRWSQILFSTNPAMGDSIRSAQPGICENAVFTPRNGRQYEVTYSAGPNFCKVSIVELVDHSDRIDRTAVEVPAISVQRVGRKKYSCGAP
jgi:hypothetical protein